MITLVRFYAKWCGPCKAAEEMVAPLREELKDDVLFTDVDIDANPQLRVDHHVTQIPTFIIFKDATEVERMQGCESTEAMREWIKSFLGGEDEQGSIQPDVLPESSGGSE